MGVPFPAEHPNKAVAGQTAELQVTIKRVEEQSLPAVDEEFRLARVAIREVAEVVALRAEVRKSAGESSRM